MPSLFTVAVPLAGSEAFTADTGATPPVSFASRFSFAATATATSSKNTSNDSCAVPWKFWFPALPNPPSVKVWVPAASGMLKFATRHPESIAPPPFPFPTCRNTDVLVLGAVTVPYWVPFTSQMTSWVSPLS